MGGAKCLRETWRSPKYLEIIAALKKGQRRTLVVGVGHPAATCEGAGFEYLMNVHADLRRRGLRDLVDLVWLTNEPEVGDFGVDGIEAMKSGSLVRGQSLVRMVLDESHIRAIAAAGVTRVEPGRIFYDQAGEDSGTIDYDFAMLIPQFRGIPLTYRGVDGADITAEMTMPSGFMRVDGNYEPKSYEQYRSDDWPALYRSPRYRNVYAVGIAFAPPHPISKTKKATNGLAIVATPPRTGMASGIMGRAAAENVAAQLDGREPDHHARMSEMPAACIASMGKSLWSGEAASIIMTPVVRDFERYPQYGRDLSLCVLDVGLNGAFRVGIEDQRDIQRQTHGVALNLNVALLHDVEQRHLDLPRQVGQFVDGKQSAIRPQQQPVVHRQLARKVLASARRLDRVQIANQIRHRHVWRRQLFHVSFFAREPRNRRLVPALRNQVAASPAHRPVGIVANLASRHIAIRSSSSAVSARRIRLFACPRSPSRIKFCFDSTAFTICGITVSS